MYKNRIKTGSIILLISVFFISACTQEKKEESTETKALMVKTESAKKMTFAENLEFPGTIFPNKEANIGASMPGKVEKIFFQPGDYVKQGAIVVQMSTEMMILSEIEYTTLQKDFNRVTNLLAKGSITQQDFDHVKAKYEAAKAKYELVKKNTQITAPFDGVIVSHIMQEGENYLFSPSLDLNFSMTSGIVKLMQINPLIVRFSVNEKLLSKIKKGQIVKVITDAYPEESFEGKVSLIHPILNANTRSVDVDVKANNKKQLLKPGMFARVIVQGIAHEGVGVPLTSISRRGNSEFVWVAKDQKAFLQKINRVAISGDYAIVNDLDEDTEIIVTKKSQLADGMSILTEK
ncbi:MAG: efflux RND transporter periplasmic adaptor subunit [Bacteroidales bacterium]|nr:efflux RND transporter periplasmic adaptor subunit [Bacteroidales bacterium]MDD4575078.1 efflux RND transporter periplasmic adaptor subunit [Bacteroidales bacterium]